MSQLPPPERDPLVRFLGWIFLVVGVLWMAFAGLCAVGMIVEMSQESSGGGAAGMWLVFGVIGLVGVASGFGVFMLGRWLARN